jgi:hypothetical protein
LVSSPLPLPSGQEQCSALARQSKHLARNSKTIGAAHFMFMCQSSVET